MKKLILILVCVIATFGFAKAQETSDQTIKVYCDVMCVQYNLFKADVNAVVDFGLADKAKNANGWIYNTETDKKFSFASPMSVFAYMAKRGWEYKDAIIITESSSMKSSQNVWHFILTKEVPFNYSDEDVIGDIDYRNK